MSFEGLYSIVNFEGLRSIFYISVPFDEEN